MTCLEQLLNYCKSNDDTNPVIDLRTSIPIFDEIGPAISESENFSNFIAKRDTWTYGILISKTLEIAKSVGIPIELVDLGIGSAIPVILGILKSSFTSLPIDMVGVDIDHVALKVAKSNVSTFLPKSKFGNLNTNYIATTFEDYFSTHKSNRPDINKMQIYCSNPPYVPVRSDHRLKSDLIAVDGGEDGLAHINTVLDHGRKEASLVSIQWSSLSSPPKLIQRLFSEFDLVHAQCWRVPFGRMTGRPDVQEFLFKLLDQNKIYFFKDSYDGSLSYLIVSTILRPL